jgi:hypothetical protein
MNRRTAQRTVALLLSLSGAAAVGIAIYFKANSPGRSATPAPARTAIAAGEQLRLQLARLPLRFEPASGQIEASADFLARGSGYTLFLTSSEAVFSMRPRSARAASRSRASIAGGQVAASGTPPVVLRMQLLGARDSRAEALEQLPGRSNYFLGNDPSKWRRDVAQYAKVRFTGVYPGIDLLYYGHQTQLEYDFVVAPGADPRRIRLAFAGAGQLRTSSDGELIAATSEGELRWKRPHVYQEREGRREAIAGGYLRLGRDEIGFQIGPYDRTQPLIIDPVLAFSTYLGGGGGNMAERVAVDGSGNVYVLSSTDPGVSVTKINPTGTAIVYTAYLGGSSTEFAGGLAVDVEGNAYVSGLTMSSDFPVVNPYQAAKKGGDDAFVAKLNPAGNTLLYSTYLGGSRSFEQATDISVDSGGNAYVFGGTLSSDFPTVNAFQSAKGGDLCEFPPCMDAFVAKLNPAGSNLLYSTYLGGNGDENFFMFGGLALDAAGNVYVTGITESPDFPTKSPLQTKFGGAHDAFVAKFDPTRSGADSLVYSTYLGGSTADGGANISVDTTGNAYVLGATYSTDFPATDGVLRKTKAGGFDAFVAKLNPAGTALVFSTYLGGSGNDALDSQTGGGIALDSAGNIYVAWTTDSADFPVVNALQASLAGPRDAYVAKLDNLATRLVYATYLGGSSSDHGLGLAVSPQGSAYVVGYTISTDFPVTPNALDTTCGSDGKCNLRDGMSYADGFVAMITEVTGPAVSLNPASLEFGDQLVETTSSPRTVTLFNSGNAALSVSAITMRGDFAATQACGGTLNAGASCTISITFTPSALGVSTGELSVSSDAPGSPHIASLSGRGIVPTPGIHLSASSLTFDNQLIGTVSGPRTITLANSGTAYLAIFEMAITGTDTSAFALTSTCAGGLDIGQSCAASVTFSPASAGAKSATLSISDDAPGSPHFVALSGAGVTPPEAALSSNSLAFAPQIINTTSAAQSVTLSNAGGSPLAISGIALGGAHAPHFTVSDNCGAGLNPGASCAINVTTRPTEVGACAASLTIAHNGSANSSTIAISGMGTDFSIAPASGSSTSATVNAGESATFQTSLAGSAGFSGAVSLTCSGAPATTTCSVSPSSVTLDGTTPASATLTVTTTPRAALLPLPRVWPWYLPLIPMVLALLALLGFARGARSLRPAWRTVAAAAVLAAALLTAGCGGGGSSSSVSPPRPSGTQPSTCSVSVQASSSGATRTVSFSVTVR